MIKIYFDQLIYALLHKYPSIRYLKKADLNNNASTVLLRPKNKIQ